MKRIIMMSILVFLISWSFTSFSAARSISGIVFDPEPPADLVFGQPVTISFDYRDIPTNDLQILVRPMSGSGYSLRQAVTGSPEYPGGSGRGSMTFTIQPGDPVTVDAIRISILENRGRDLLFEFTVPARYTFRSGDGTVLRYPLMTIKPRVFLVPDTENEKREPVGLPEINKYGRPALVGHHLKIRPDIAERFISTMPAKFPTRKEDRLLQAPFLRPPESPPGMDAAWSYQMNNWMSRLNDVLLQEIILVVDEDKIIDQLLNYEKESRLDTSEQAGFRLNFLQKTQGYRTGEDADENDNP